jgi:uncharacterized membrane protein
LETIQNSKLENVRIQSVDVLRGIVMIIMAIDHIRVYSGILPGGTTAAIFFSRWITHYCAPSFAFLAGTSAFLFFQKSGNRSELVRFLFTRGLLLVILEITIIRFFWTFNFDYSNFVQTNIIWALGWSLIFLSALVRLRPTTIAVIGLVIIFGQQVFEYVPYLFPDSYQESVAKIWAFFYPTPLAAKSNSSSIPGLTFATNYGFTILYVILPWLGVVMTGYGFAQIFSRTPEQIKKICLFTGISAVVLFIILGTLFILKKPVSEVPFIFKLLAQQKYPPSQLYLLMTLGPLIALIPWAERIKGKVSKVLILIGRVPLFYYLVHLLVIHLSAYVVNILMYGDIHSAWYNTAPFVSIQEADRWSLSLLYLVWLIDVTILYFICRWYALYKSNHPDKKWLKYL